MRACTLAGISVVAAVVAATGTLAQTRPASAPASAPSTGPSSAPSEVAELVRRLGGDDDHDRDAAQRQLVERGMSVVEQLRGVAKGSDDPDVRSRAAAAVAEIEEHDANDATLVTLHVKDAAAQDVWTELGKQSRSSLSGVSSFALGNKGGRTVTLDVDRQPFWEVFANVCGQLNVCPMPDAPAGHALRMFPFPRNWITQGPHQVDGPFWVGLSQLYLTRSIDLLGPPVADEQFFVSLIVLPEPKLVVTQISPLTLTEAGDDAGNSLLPTGVAAANPMAFLPRPNGASTRVVRARLSYPEHPGKRIAVLSGTVNVTLAQAVQRFEVDDVLGAAKVVAPLPQCQVTAKVTRQSPTQFQVAVDCVRAGMSDQQWYALTNRLTDLSLEDADGHPLLSYGWIPAPANNDATFRASATFRLPMVNNQMLVNRPPAGPIGEPRRIVWNVASRFKTVTLPVSFHDLPMP